MKCNYNNRFARFDAKRRFEKLEKKDREEINRCVAELAADEFKKIQEDNHLRSIYLCGCAMLEAGLSGKTVTKVIRKFEDVCAMYKHYKTDDIADYVLCEKLRAAGVDVQFVKEEQ